MKWTLMAASAAVAMTLSLPAIAAQQSVSPVSAPAAPPPSATAAEEPITFEQYREWRLDYIERRRTDLTIQLSAGDLSARQKSRLEQVKAYYDWMAGLPNADRDRRFRERFDRIDANHDGKIDAAERTAWREKQNALFNRRGGAQQAAETEHR